VKELVAENKRLEQWVQDCQAGMYVNCVYCGHRYGPDDQVPVAMADVLKEHIEQCPRHPMSILKGAVQAFFQAFDSKGDVEPAAENLRRLAGVKMADN